MDVRRFSLDSEVLIEIALLHNIDLVINLGLVPGMVLNNFLLVTKSRFSLFNLF